MMENGTGAGTGGADCLTIQELLVEQLAAVERSVALNATIFERLFGTSPPTSQARHTGSISGVPRAPEISRLNRYDPEHLKPAEPALSWPNASKQQELTQPLLAAEQGAPLNESLPPLLTRSASCDDDEVQRVIRSGSFSCDKDFIDRLEHMKGSIHEALKQPRLAVVDLYASHGIWQKIVRSSSFDHTSFVIIILNTVWVAIDTDLNKPDELGNSPWIFAAMDNLFCFYFFVEITIRFMAFSHARNVFHDSWFIFDTFLVVIVVWGTWLKPLMVVTIGNNEYDGGNGNYSVLRLFRILRLLRIFRTARLLRSMPALRILAKAMMTAMRSTLSILCLLGIVIYVFAILFTQQLAGTEVGKDRFSSVPHSMNFLLLQTLCGSDTTFITNLLNEHWMYYLLYLLFMFIGTQTIMNMLIGVICEVVSVVAAAEEEEMFVDFAVPRIQEVIEKVDIDGSCSISKDELLELLRHHEVLATLQTEGVDVMALIDFVPFFFRNSKEIAVKDFLGILTHLRGSKGATLKDLVDTQCAVSRELRLVGGSIAQKQTALLTSVVEAAKTEIAEFCIGWGDTLAKGQF
eukprot:TRINITY_DN23228_c0_g1_i1.p1 TRINITY_DN23228_c0_g1~~TRINITY_DN23228_c0_g1_i1.p1  ORF type:complete len:576 (-),score=100.67 TRINITY_DN23228_c0_g1_i1:40-1767(-)